MCKIPAGGSRIGAGAACLVVCGVKSIDCITNVS